MELGGGNDLCYCCLEEHTFIQNIHMFANMYCRRHSVVYGYGKASSKVSVATE